MSPVARLVLFLSLPLFLIDQASKWWILSRFEAPPPHDGFWVIEGWFEITRVHNMGVAFGMGNGQPWANWLFGGIAAGAFVMIIVLLKRGFFPGKLGYLAAGLLLAGIPGNLFDRIVHGYVVDFVHMRLPLYDKIVPSSQGWWPAYNVADACICVAAALLFILSFMPEHKEEKPVESKVEEGGDQTQDS